MDGRQLLSVNDVKTYTGYSLSHIYKAIAKGKLNTAGKRPVSGGKVGRPKGAGHHRFRLAEVDYWIEHP